MATPLALFVGSWLSFSETFIYDQVRRQSRFEAWVAARRIGTHAERFPYPRVLTLPRLEEALYVHGIAPRISRYLDASGARLVHAHFGTNGVLALPFLRRRDLPLAVTFHGHDVAGLLPENARTWRYGRYQRHAPRMFERASLLMCCSSELAERLVEVGAPEEKIRVHRLGVDLSRFTVAERPDRPPTVLMVGRLVEKKGVAYALEAFARVRARVPEARLRVVGDGPLRGRLEARAEALGVSEAVTFVGVLDAEGVRAEMAAADLLTAPSVTGARGDRESGVIVLKEAAATGLPAVGTRHGGIPEIIEDGTTGFLVGERDVDALASALSALVEDPALRRRMGAAARAKIEREYDTVRQNARLEARLAALL